MALILRIYTADKIIESEIDLGHKYTIGNSVKDDIQINEIELEKNCLTVQTMSNGWFLSSKSWKYLSMLVSAASSSFPFEKIIVLDDKKQFAVSVYESAPDYSRTIDISHEDKIVVGRSSSCGITIHSKQVSSQHIELIREEDGWFFRDLNSSNGTFLNGKRSKCGMLQSDDIVCLGFCRIFVSENTLTVVFSGQITNNIIPERKSKGIRSNEEPYPHLFSQSPRLKDDLLVKEIDLQSPPNIGGKPQISWLSVLLTPALTVCVMLGICFFVTGVMTMLYFSVPMTLIGVVMSIVRYRSEKKKYKEKEKLRLDKYEKYLSEQEQTIEQYIQKQQKILVSDNPSVSQCMHIASGPDRTLWDRKIYDTDFMSLRIGKGAIPAAVKIKTPKQMVSLEVDMLASRPAQIAEEYTHVKNCPIVIDLGQKTTCGVIGKRKESVSLGKNLVVQAATHHSYRDLRIVVICDPDERDMWSFCRWLPHLFDDTRSIRYFADTPQQAQKMLNQLTDTLSQRALENSSSEYGIHSTHQPIYMIVCASLSLVTSHPIMKYLTANDQKLGVCSLFLFNSLDNLPKECNYIIDTNATTNVLYEKDHASTKQQFIIDYASEDQYDSFARSLAPIRVEATDKQGELPTSISFLQGYCAKTPQMLGLEKNWGKIFPEQGMAVPIGVKQDGKPFCFDIHEKKCGPHGLVAGMTGSGKSEMVQAWILSMAVRFSPSDVSFVLIDFKGTGLLLPFKNLPHLAGTISDLDSSIGRNLIALENELARRKALLDQHQVTNIAGYLKLLRQGKATKPLPYLFIVIDEFAEFKARFPDFMQVVNRVFAIGRTLGVHMILLTQKPANIVDDKMNANTRFRWCLKVASSADSRDMLRHPDAAKITNPGRAFVQVGEDEIFEEIQSYWSGAPYNPYRDLSLQRATKVSVVDLYGNRICYELEKTTGYRSEKSEIDAVVEYLDTYTRQNNIARANAIWTNKLPETLVLSEILHLAFDGERWAESEQGLRPAIGLLDDPRSQSQYPYYLDFAKEGHIMVYGAPGTGKTTLLHTAIISLALSYPPDAVSMYMLDFAGGSLNLFYGLPHVGGVAIGGQDDEKVEKLSTLLLNELNRRKKVLSTLGLVNISSYTSASGMNMPYIVVFLDNFTPVLDLYPTLDVFFQTIARDGGSCGIFLMMTATTPNSVSYRISQNIKSMIALRMPDKNDYSVIVGRTEGLEPEVFPGRGLIRGNPPLEFQTALPIEGKNEFERVSNIRNLVAMMDAKWEGSRAVPIPVMPERVCTSDYHCTNLFVGLACQDISPRSIDIRKKQFLLLSTVVDCTNTFYVLSQNSIAQLNANQVISYGQSVNGVESLFSVDFDKAIADLMPILQERKDLLSRTNYLSESQYPHIIILIHNLKECFDTVSDETVRRLASIISLGNGLNVAMIACGNAKEIEKLYHGGDMLAMNLVRQSVILLIGGSAQVHSVVQTELQYSEATTPLLDNEAYIVQDSKTEKIKIVQE